MNILTSTYLNNKSVRIKRKLGRINMVMDNTSCSIGFLPGLEVNGGTCLTDVCYKYCPAVKLMEEKKE